MAETSDDNEKDIVKEAVKQFVNASMHGEKPDLDELVKQYPGLESQIRRGIQELNKINNLFDSLVKADESDFEDITEEQDLVGEKIGSFEIVSIIGRGGMGVVYLAKDTKLKRSVAIKSIPAAVADNSTTRTRFKREAELLASLNHPNIAVIYEIVEKEKSGFLVLEHVEGETLTKRIARGPLKLEEALSIGKQVAEAISAAHKKGIVHRDLKPGNIKITPDGQIKVLDFGLAKTTLTEGGSSNITETQAGHIIGTPAYMSPEQARGQPIDKRSDIWSFGCVLYEMLTGRILFQGSTTTDTLADILHTEPDWQTLPKSTPTNIRVLLRRCLEKDPVHRLHDIADARIEISETLAGTLDEFAPPIESMPSPQWLQLKIAIPILFLLIVGTSLLSVIVMKLVEPPTSRPPVVSEFLIDLPAGRQIRLNYTNRCYLAISPDGSHLVYAGRQDESDGDQLYLRSMDDLEITPIPGTENAWNPFFSPDGQWVGFYDYEAKALKKVPLAGGEPIPLVKGIPPSGVAFAHWAEDGTIFISSLSCRHGLYRLSENDGTLEYLIPPDESGKMIRYQQVLPGAKAILCRRSGYPTGRALEVFFPDTGEYEIVLEDASYGMYVRTGHLLFVRDNIIMGVPFDVKRCKKTGPVVSLLSDVEFDWDSSTPQLAMSENGTVVYIRDTPPDKYEVTWIDRQGRPGSPAVPALPLWEPMAVRLSPDERRIALMLSAPKGFVPQIHLFDLTRGTRTSLTTEGINYYPRWSPDGSEIAFWSARPVGRGLYCKSVDSSAPPELLAPERFPSALLWPGSWSPDGKSLVCLSKSDRYTGNDIWILPVEGERTPEALCETESNESNPRFSPDGRWLAYVSNESGENEVYLMPCLPRLDFERRFPVSSGGGRLPIWSRDASELYYNDGEGMMAVKISSDPNAPVGPPERLFLFADLNAEGDNYGHVSDVCKDGRFLVSKKVTDEIPGRQLICIQNWFEELKRLSPPRKD
jgi:serine/threonine protein kinase/Tol biopolymer transport system component